MSTTSPTVNATIVPAVVVDVLAAQGVHLESSEAAIVSGVDGLAHVDVDSLSEHDARIVSDYWETCQRFWRNLHADEEPGPYVALRREIRIAQQKDNKDLAAELAALDTAPGVGAAVGLTLESNPDWSEVRSLVDAAGGEFSQSGDGETTLVYMVGREEAFYWPPELGGPYAPGEMARELVVVIRHAAWRDRRVRRLVRTEVYAHELWPRI